MGSPYETIELDRMGTDRWNEFVSGVNEGWMFVRTEYIQGVMTWPRCRDQSFAVVDNGRGEELTAVLPLLL